MLMVLKSGNISLLAKPPKTVARIESNHCSQHFSKYTLKLKISSTYVPRLKYHTSTLTKYHVSFERN
jgi:hypothetical protein